MSGKTVLAWTLSCYFLQVPLVKCTIDMTISDFTYVAEHLSKTDCRRLVASLQYLDYDLPNNLSDEVKKISKKVPCIQLLLAWNSGEPIAGGKGRSHVDVSHRLRQLNKKKLADWLENTVFYELAFDVDKTFNTYPFKDHEIIKSTTIRHVKNEEINTTDDWTSYDTVLWTGITAGVGFALYQVIDCACISRRRRNVDQCELRDLLVRDNFDSDEDYASENIFFNSIEHFDED